MPRFNVKRNDTEYYVFSSISDGFIHKFDSFEQLQEWRKKEYGKSNFKNEETFEELNANKMDYKEALKIHEENN